MSTERTIADQLATAKALGSPFMTVRRTKIEELAARAAAADRIEQMLDRYQQGEPMPAYADLRGALESRP